MRFSGYLLLLYLPFSSPLVRAQTRVIDSLQKIVKENNRDAAEIIALNKLASEFTRTDLSKAKGYLLNSIALAGNVNSPVLLSHAYSQMVTVRLNTGQTDSAQYYLELLRKLALESSSPDVNENYHFTAGLYYKIQGNFKAALPFMLEALREEILRTKNSKSGTDRISLAGQNLNVGNVYTNLGEYKNALQYHLKSLRLFEESGNKKGLSFCYESIGGDFIHLNQYSQALPYIQESVSIKKEINDKRGIATAFSEMGTVYIGLHQFDLALSYYMKALAIIQEMKLTAEEEKVSFAIGKTYELKTDPVTAELYLHKSKLLALQIGDSAQSAAADAEIISMRSASTKQRQAEKELLGSLKTSIGMGDKSSELLNYQYLADHYAKNKQFDKALAYSNKFHQINDSLQSTELQLQIKKLEEQYNLEKNEKEILLLKKDQQLTHLSLQKQRAFQLGSVLFLFFLVLTGFLIISRNRSVNRTRRLIELENMRNRIARDLHDDIGSTITSINIISKVSLQQSQDNSQMGSNMQKVKDRSAAVMESMSDIVWAIDPQHDTIDQMIFRMKEFAAEILEPLNIIYSFRESGELTTVKLDMKKRKDFYLLFKEAVNNAAKHSGCRRLNISLQEDKQFLRLEIADDGTGFEEHEIKNGNGLINMRRRADSMEAGIRIDSDGNGTLVSVVIPIP